MALEALEAFKGPQESEVYLEIPTTFVRAFLQDFLEASNKPQDGLTGIQTKIFDLCIVYLDNLGAILAPRRLKCRPRLQEAPKRPLSFKRQSMEADLQKHARLFSLLASF